MFHIVHTNRLHDKQPMVTSYPTLFRAQEQDAVRNGVLITKADDIVTSAMTGPQLVDLFNYLRPTDVPVVKKFENRVKAARRIWVLMDRQAESGQTFMPKETELLAKVEAEEKSGDVSTAQALTIPVVPATGAITTAAAVVSKEEDNVSKTKTARKPREAGAGSKRSGASVSERILKFCIADDGKTSAQVKAHIAKAFPDRTETAVDNTVRGTLSVLCRAKTMLKARVDGKGLVYTTSAAGKREVEKASD